jgi:Ca2+-binding RTX toxin-like protein
MASVYGTDNSETLDAADGVTEGFDTIFGYLGDDVIYGLGGNDTLKGGGGADQLFGGSGIDSANYSDSTVGVTVNLTSGPGIGGTAEGDTYSSIEDVWGSAHADFLTGNASANVLKGLEDDDFLKGGGGADTLDGGSGNDTLKGGGGADTLSGGTGIDTASYAGSAARVVISLIDDTASEGDAAGDELNSIENLTGSDHDDKLFGNNVANTLRGLDGDDLFHGHGGNDSIWGGAGDDAVWAMDGNDTVRGEGGNDRINGGAGIDTLIGGTGNDDYYIEDTGDILVESAGGGTDTVYASVNFTLSAGVHVEQIMTLFVPFTIPINLTGNERAQTIHGNDGINILDGGGGADEMYGYAGNDIYYVDNAGDIINEYAAAGTDNVRSSITYSLSTNVDRLNLLGSANIDGTGNSLANILTGNDGANVLSGAGGNDALDGSLGNDTLIGSGGNDSFFFTTALGANNIDTITGFSVADDTIKLDNSVFTALTATGTLAAAAFTANATGAATTAAHRIIYETDTGELFYDSNGSAAGGAKQFADLAINLALTNADFLVV